VPKESLTDLINGYRPRTGPNCLVAIVLSKMSKDEQAELNKALADHSITGSAIKRALNLYGHEIGASSIYRHRRKECTCESQ
jgi:hypothetical protein